MLMSVLTSHAASLLHLSSRWARAKIGQKSVSARGPHALALSPSSPFIDRILRFAVFYYSYSSLHFILIFLRLFFLDQLDAEVWD